MLFLMPADLRGLDARALEDLLGRNDLTVAFGEGEVAGLAAAALLFADHAVIRTGTTLSLDTAEGWAAVAWRLGRGAYRWYLRGGTAEELVDETTDQEPHVWLARWTENRSLHALDSAAALIRGRGGDRLERAEFARLFAIGEPQKGLGAFLARKKADFV
jgi:hypothetical protein